MGSSPPRRRARTRGPGSGRDDAVDEDARCDDDLGIDLARLATTSATCTIVVLPAIAMIGAKLRAVLLKTRLP
jgi:hypothetical protein